MEENHSFVSIIVPVYNGERNIRKCIESLISLNYPSSRKEIIVVDNNSKDNTLSIVKEYPVVVLEQTSIQSSYASRNTGLRNSRGEIIAFTDSDCIAEKDWIKNAVKYFEDEKTGCVCGKIRGHSPSNFIEEYLIRNRCLEQGIDRFLPYAQTANAVYRRKVFDTIGLFEERWISGGDADLTWRMQLQSGYKMVTCDDALIYHVHRSTLKGYFRQRMTWGQGEVSLYKKYRNHYQNKEGELIRDYKHFMKQFVLKTPYFFYHMLFGKNESLHQDEMLTMLAELGRRLGRIRGSVRERVFYI